MLRTLALAGLGLLLACPPRASAQEAGVGITEIRLKRTPCFGTCPVDEVVLKPDGTATYDGHRFTKRMGRYRGTFSAGDFERLAELLEKQGFFALNDRYEIRATDLPSVVTTATRGGEVKEVVNYGNAGPLELWAIEKAIRGVVAEVEWEKVE